jgi:predicted transcriptional regulator
MEINVKIHTLDILSRTWIQDEAQRTGASVETVIERLIQRGIAVERQSARGQRYHDLDSLAGTWSAEDANAFRVATMDFVQIEAALWQ